MEIEIKARFTEKERVENGIIKAGGEKKGEKHQIDQYYSHPVRGMTVERLGREINEYIRLRKNFGDDKGIFAYHVNVKEGVTDEHEVEVSNVEKFKKILALSGFKELGIIDKKRQTFSLNGFKITVDEVKDVGNFVEVEIQGEEHEISDKKAECLQILELIGLSKDDVCEGIWLCDIATGRK